MTPKFAVSGICDRSRNGSQTPDSPATPGRTDQPQGGAIQGFPALTVIVESLKVATEIDAAVACDVTPLGRQTTRMGVTRRLNFSDWHFTNPNRQLAVDVLQAPFHDSELSVWFKARAGHPVRQTGFTVR